MLEVFVLGAAAWSIGRLLLERRQLSLLESSNRVRVAVESCGYRCDLIAWGWSGLWRTVDVQVSRREERFGSVHLGFTCTTLAREVERIYDPNTPE